MILAGRTVKGRDAARSDINPISNSAAINASGAAHGFAGRNGAATAAPARRNARRAALPRLGLAPDLVQFGLAAPVALLGQGLRALRQEGLHGFMRGAAYGQHGAQPGDLGPCALAGVPRLGFVPARAGQPGSEGFDGGIGPGQARRRRGFVGDLPGGFVGTGGGSGLGGSARDRAWLASSSAKRRKRATV